jgi:hypothetical protein
MVTSKDIRDELAKTQKNLRDQIEFIERDYALMTKDYNTYLAALSIND